MEYSYRACENCGSKMSPHFPRVRGEDGKLLCKGCAMNQPQAQKTALPFDEDVTWAGNLPPSEKVYLLDTNIEPIYNMDAQSHLWPRAEAQSLIGQQLPHWRQPAREIADPKDGWYISWGKSPFSESGAWNLRNRTYMKHVAHESGDESRIYHCPFCGSGQVTAVPDGSAKCDFCDSTFTVKRQPNFPATPQTIDGKPYLHPEDEGEAGEFDEPTEPEEGAEELPLEEGEGEGEEEEEELPAFLQSSRVYSTGQGQLDEDAYIKHLAIKHAPNRAEVITTIRGSNAKSD